MFCIYCGEEIDNKEICSHCGKKLLVNSDAVSDVKHDIPLTAKNNKKRNMLFLILGIILLILMATYLTSNRIDDETKAVIDDINQVVSSEDYSMEEITNVISEYELLTDKQKEKVDNYDKLLSAKHDIEEKLAKEESIMNTLDAVNTLCDGRNACLSLVNGAMEFVKIYGDSNLYLFYKENTDLHQQCITWFNDVEKCETEIQKIDFDELYGTLPQIKELYEAYNKIYITTMNPDYNLTIWYNNLNKAFEIFDNEYYLIELVFNASKKNN